MGKIYSRGVFGQLGATSLFSPLLFFFQRAEIPVPTARRILGILTEGGILKILTPASGRRAATYCFPVILNLAEGREVF